MIQFHQKNNVVYLTFDILDQYPGVVHGVFTRQGGASMAPFASLNVGKGTGDDLSTVLENRRAIPQCLGEGTLFFLSQVHGTGVVVADDMTDMTDMTNMPAQSAPPEADAAVSGTPGTLLVVQTADCQSVMLYDPLQKTAANIHAGWRGSIANIIGNCVETMKNRFGSDPESLVAAIGPSLGPCCAQFIHYKTEIPEPFHAYGDDQHRFNFWQISHDQLRASGVRGDNIEWSNICTRCNPHLFFSYRQANITGRFASVIGIT